MPKNRVREEGLEENTGSHIKSFPAVMSGWNVPFRVLNLQCAANLRKRAFINIIYAHAYRKTVLCFHRGGVVVIVASKSVLLWTCRACAYTPQRIRW